MPSYSPQDVQDELLKVIRTSQETVVEAVKTWVETVKAVTPKVPSAQVPLAHKLPKPQDIVTNAYDFPEKLLSGQAQREALGSFIRTHPQMANLSLPQLADLTSLSNPYLSQVERGLHEPSVRVLKAISDALNVSAETLLAQAGLVDAVAGEKAGAPDEAGEEERTEAAIAADTRLNDDQKAALTAVYRSMVDRS